MLGDGSTKRADVANISVTGSTKIPIEAAKTPNANRTTTSVSAPFLPHLLPVAQTWCRRSQPRIATTAGSASQTTAPVPFSSINVELVDVQCSKPNWPPFAALAPVGGEKERAGKEEEAPGNGSGCEPEGSPAARRDRAHEVSLRRRWARQPRIALNDERARRPPQANARRPKPLADRARDSPPLAASQAVRARVEAVRGASQPGWIDHNHRPAVRVRQRRRRAGARDERVDHARLD